MFAIVAISFRIIRVTKYNKNKFILIIFEFFLKHLVLIYKLYSLIL